MSRPSNNNELTLFKPWLLITEFEEDFASLSAALEQEIKPRGIIERMYVAEIAYLVWEILRLRRCEVAIINAAFEEALNNILRRLTAVDQDARDAVVRDWFVVPNSQGKRSRNCSLSIISTSWPSRRKHSDCARGSRAARSEPGIGGGPPRQGAALHCRASAKPGQASPTGHRSVPR